MLIDECYIVLIYCHIIRTLLLLSIYMVIYIYTYRRVSTHRTLQLYIECILPHVQCSNTHASGSSKKIQMHFTYKICDTHCNVSKIRHLSLTQLHVHVHMVPVIKLGDQVAIFVLPCWKQLQFKLLGYFFEGKRWGSYFHCSKNEVSFAAI